MARRLLAILCLIVTLLQSFVAAQSDVKEFVLIVSLEVLSPACSPRLSLLVNGTLPGPELHVNAGDHVHVR
jgi:hypothetical protein